MLRSAFNALARVHSRPATLKRLGSTGSPDLFTPARISPSNYFRFLKGPEYTNIPGREFVIPADTITGHFAQKITFSIAPTTGVFRFQYSLNQTTDLAFNESAANIQVALRLLPGLSNLVVTGTVANLTVEFRGFQALPDLLAITGSTLDQTGAVSRTNVAWANFEIKRGDRIIDGARQFTIDEIMEMPDVGGSILGWRCRCE